MSKKIIHRLLAISAMGLMIAGCGQKGPLTLPTQEPQKEQQKESPEPSDKSLESDKKGN